MSLKSVHLVYLPGPAMQVHITRWTACLAT